MFDAVDRLSTALEGRYTIERELGEGGMATAYLADDLKHERKVALKVLHESEKPGPTLTGPGSPDLMSHYLATVTST